MSWPALGEKEIDALDQMSKWNGKFVLEVSGPSTSILIEISRKQATHIAANLTDLGLAIVENGEEMEFLCDSGS